MIKKFFIAVAVSVLGLNFIFSADALQAANRRTAIRCLKLAESYLSANDLGNALSQAELGLSYDESVSDLWYIKAAAKAALGETRAALLPLVTHSLTEGEWVDYNKDGARVLYADLLCDTGSFFQSVAVLDASPFIYSADAEFIRIKSYYRQRTKESISKARSKVNSARKMYPDDTRFPRVFFRYEYALSCLEGDSSVSDFSDEAGEILVSKIADSFIAKMPEYDNPDSELEIYAALFASGEQQRRMVQAFSAHGMSHPLYAIAALDCGLMSEQDAWDYFCSFADKSISLLFLNQMLLRISDEVTAESVKEHLTAFSGVLTVDDDFDCEPNLTVHYSRGRPAYITYDKENDGIEEWSCECDFGVPESLLVTRGNIMLLYGTWPGIIKAVFRSERQPEGEAVFNLVDEAFSWSPFSINVHSFAKELCGADFFIPVVDEELPPLNENMLLRHCSSYEISSDEYPGARISFIVIGGLPQTAQYSADGRIYANAVFSDGLPVARSIDKDGDGIFETVETFGFDPNNLMNLSKEEQRQVMTNVFGRPVDGSGIYIRMIQLDSNGDTRPDFTEEYGPSGERTTSWDFDGDGNWDVRYKRYARKNQTEPLTEEALFYTVPKRQLVSVLLKNGIPQNVSLDGAAVSVTPGESKSLYWLGDAGSASDEVCIMENSSLLSEQGVCRVFQNGENRIMAVKIEGITFAKVIPPYDESTYFDKEAEAQEALSD